MTTKGLIVGALTEKDDGTYTYQQLTPELSWEMRFPHVVTIDDEKEHDSFWLRDPTIAPDDRVTFHLLDGNNYCDICKAPKARTELQVAVMYRDSREPGPFADYKEYGFYLECNSCKSADSTYTGQSGKSSVITPVGGYGTYGMYAVPCPDGHFELHRFGRRQGGLIMSSWRGTNGGKIASNADYCMFFTDEWRTFWAPPVESYPSSKGVPMLALPTAPEFDLPPCAILKWWDFTTPPLTVIKYAEMAADLIRDNKVVQIGCIGGHGRTGTFAALVGLSLGRFNSSGAAMAWLRENYCKDAIESKVQEDSVHAYAKSLGLHGADARANVGTATPKGDSADIDDDGAWYSHWAAGG